MNTIILRTHIQSNEEREALESIIEQLPEVFRWNLDLDDCDKVLKVVGGENLTESDVMKTLYKRGISAELMSD